jgi:hypothetical protein
MLVLISVGVRTSSHILMSAKYCPMPKFAPIPFRLIVSGSVGVVRVIAPIAVAVPSLVPLMNISSAVLVVVVQVTLIRTEVSSTTLVVEMMKV